MLATVQGASSSTEWFTPQHSTPAWSPSDQAWLLTRYADVAAAFRAPALGVVDVHDWVMRVARGAGRDYSSLTNFTGANLPYRNPPFHPPARRLLKQWLTLTADSFKPDVLLDLASEVVETAVRRGRADAVADIGMRIPLLVMTRALGLSYETGETILRGGVWRRALPLRGLDAMESRIGEAEAQIGAAMTLARHQKSGGLATLIELNEGEFDFTPRELIGFAIFLIVAGAYTTAGMLSSAIWLLLSNPDQAEQVSADPSLADGAINEVLRYACPVRRPNSKVSSGPLTLAGRDFQAEEILILDLEQAHHDPEAYSDPDRFDIARRGPPVLAFGTGAHACLGAWLARLEGRALLAALPPVGSVRLVDPTPRWQNNPLFRHLTRLDVVF